mgnify:CR=1 FL=1
MRGECYCHAVVQVGRAARLCVASLCLGACAADPPSLPSGGTDGSGTASTATESAAATTTDDGADASSTAASTDGPTTDATGVMLPVALTLDIAIVVDNTLGNGAAQARLAQAMDGLVAGLRATTVDLDVHVVLTTPDFGNPACTRFQPAGYAPALGAPQARTCRDHLSDFTSLSGSVQMPEVCEQVCPEGTVLPGQVLAFTLDGSNVEGATIEDALRCLVPQGINGCGFESTLRAATTLVDPTQCWNDPACTEGGQTFLRPEADLAVIVMTDELDCSLGDPELTADQGYWTVDPSTGQPALSSAICFTVGAACEGPDASGTFTNCSATADGNMLLVEEIVQRLVVANPNKHVTFVPIVGYDEAGPAMTEYRTWREGEWPAGDLTPEQVAQGETAAYQDHVYGLGPGCVGMSRLGGWTQGIAPIRIREVCETVDDADNGDCCPASVCGDFDAAMQCLVDRATSAG